MRDLRFLTAGTLLFLILATLFLPSATFAADASAKAVLDAVSEGVAAGACEKKKQVAASDCYKTVISCSSQQWGNYVQTHYTNQGGSVQVNALAAALGQKPSGAAVEYLQANWTRNSETPPGPVQTGTCFCECGANENLQACQGKPAGTRFRQAEDLTYDECVGKCSPRRIAIHCAGTLNPLSSGPAPAALANALAFCFTGSECTAQGGVFESPQPGNGCRDNKGRCIAPEQEVQLNQPIGNVTKIRGLGQYIVTVYSYAISIAVVVATIMFVYGAFLYLLGAAIESIHSGKQIMKDAVVGLILVLSATAILRTVNPATTKIDPTKVYLVNTVRFISSVLCKDVGGSPKLAEAGVSPVLRPYEEVAKNASAFSITPAQATCGLSYWVKDAVGSACEGTTCPQGESCVSCADGKAPGCNGQKSDRKACRRVTFTGTINYTDSRRPTELDLIAVCNGSANTNNYQTLQVINEVGVERVARGSGAQATDVKQIGSASYEFSLTEASINAAVTKCQNEGGFRGALIGLIYNDVGYLGTGVGINDVAMLSKVNGGSARFAGYADGSSSDEADFINAYNCGIKKGDLKNSAIYWSEQDLRGSLSGRPIDFSFSLSNANAQSDPESKWCQ